MNAIFKDLKVIELASVLAGPSVGQFFAELGAEVIKIENPITGGDVTRSWKLASEKDDAISAYFSCVNWGKKSVFLNIKNDGERKKLYELTRTAHIVISSYKPGDDVKLGVDYNTLKEINPPLIYGQITGYGQLSDRVGYDAIIQAESGFMSINGEKNSMPLKMPVALMDILAGHQLKEALLVGYINYLKTGKGDKFSVSLIESGLTSLANQATNFLIAQSVPAQKGSLHPNIAPYGEMYELADSRILLLAVGSDRQFRSLCSILNIEIDSNLESNIDRVNQRELLNAQLEPAIIKMNPDDLINQLAAHNVPAGIVNSIPQAISAYATHIGLIRNEKLTGIRTFVAQSENTKISSHLLPPPSPGEHTEEILASLI